MNDYAELNFILSKMNLLLNSEDVPNPHRRVVLFAGAIQLSGENGIYFRSGICKFENRGTFERGFDYFQIG